ncbi:hypothetical protein D1Z90_17405 [Motilimonas pumila]|uniref:Uncharacterized protein n=2 Tax=Motilimonas pumila TaxID=2303987 RepID=A0A418YAQ2_9GAMM|nr:hypothetical protein D1Z90_17405 [Motilimonas pumila]
MYGLQPLTVVAEVSKPNPQLPDQVVTWSTLAAKHMACAEQAMDSKDMVSAALHKGESLSAYQKGLSLSQQHNMADKFKWTTVHYKAWFLDNHHLSPSDCLIDF